MKFSGFDQGGNPVRSKLWLHDSFKNWFSNLKFPQAKTLKKPTTNLNESSPIRPAVSPTETPHSTSTSTASYYTTRNKPRLSLRSMIRWDSMECSDSTSTITARFQARDVSRNGDDTSENLAHLLRQAPDR